MEEVYVKIEKKILVDRWNRLNNRIREIEELDRDESFPIDELGNLKNSFKEISYIISKTKPILENETT